MRFEKTYRRAIREIRKTVASRTPKRRTNLFGRVFVPAGVVSLALAATVVLIGMPKKAEARDFEQIANALGKTRTYHMVMKGSYGETITERWQDGQRMRSRYEIRKVVDPSYGIVAKLGPGVNFTVDRAFDGKRIWNIWSNNHTATIATEDHWGFGDNRDLDIDRLVEGWRKQWKLASTAQKTRVGDDLVITLDNSDKTRQLRIVADAKKYRPKLAEYLVKDKAGNYLASTTNTFEYPKKIDDDVFALHLPPGYVLYDYDQAVATLKSGLEGDGPHATVGGVTVTFCGAFQSEDGLTIAVWRGGGTPPGDSIAGAVDAQGKAMLVDIASEDGDRDLPKNHGIPPKNKPKPIPAEKVVNVLRPLGRYKGQPYFGLWIRHLQSDPNVPVKLKITIPVCKKVARYLQQPSKTYRVKHLSSGVQVGTAVFEVTTIPVAQIWNVVKKVDPEHMPSWIYYPANSIGMDPAQKIKLSEEVFEARIAWERRSH